MQNRDLFCPLQSSAVCDSSTSSIGSPDVQGTVSAAWTQHSTRTGLTPHAWPLFCPADLCTRLGLLSSPWEGR